MRVRRCPWPWLVLAAACGGDADPPPGGEGEGESESEAEAESESESESESEAEAEAEAEAESESEAEAESESEAESEAESEGEPACEVPAGGVFRLSGRVAAGPGGEPPARARALVVWPVVTGGDYLYAFGRGCAAGATFEVAFPTEPPSAALNFNFGVGIVVLLPPGAEVPDGMVAEDVLSGARGASARYAIVWRRSGDFGWVGRFPAGWACGACVDAAPDQQFDEFAPVACDEVTVRVGDLEALDVCEWS